MFPPLLTPAGAVNRTASVLVSDWLELELRTRPVYDSEERGLSSTKKFAMLAIGVFVAAAMCVEGLGFKDPRALRV